LMMVCAVSTEFDLHAYMVSKPRTKTCSLWLRAFTPGLTPGVLSPFSDRK
jgi:hypothetical protein